MTIKDLKEIIKDLPDDMAVKGTSNNFEDIEDVDYEITSSEDMDTSLVITIN